MELQFAYTDPRQEPFGINQLISNYGESEENAPRPAPKGVPEKKVRFREELGLAAAQPLLFESEKPQPLSFTKSAPKPQPSPTKPGKSTKLGKKLKKSKAQKGKKEMHPKIARKPVDQKSGWNDNTATTRFFDPSLEKKQATSRGEKREAAGKAIEVSNEGYKMTGKIQNVGNAKTVEIYRDVGQLLNEETKQTKTTFLRKGAGKLTEPQKTVQQVHEKGKENKADANKSGEEEMVDPEKERMRQEFAKKNEYLKGLKEELSTEKALRSQMDAEYKTKMESMSRVVKDAMSLAQKKRDLDLTPKREVPEPEPTRTAKPIPKKEAKVPAVVPRILRKPSPPKLRRLKPKPLLRRPKTAAPVQHPAPPHKSPTKPITVFTQEMQKREIERQVQLDAKTGVALDRLSRFTQNPNEELKGLSHDLTAFENKMKPTIEKVDQTIKDIERIERIKSKGSLIGMVSNISARYIITYADKITDLIVEDLMEEFAIEMNEIEEDQRANILYGEQQNIALALLENVEQLEEEQQRMKNRWLGLSEQKRKVETGKETLTGSGYVNPFAEIEGEQMEPRKEEVEDEESKKAIVIYKPARTDLLLPLERRKKIQEYARLHREHRKTVEGSANADLWKVYDHITNDILSSLLDESSVEMSDILEQCVEQMIANEFNV